MTELPDEKTQLAKYVFWRLNNGTTMLSERQIGLPWDWIYSTEPIMKNGESVVSYVLKGVKVPADGEYPSHSFMLNEIRL